MGLGDRIAVMSAARSASWAGRRRSTTTRPTPSWRGSSLAADAVLENDGALVGFRAENLLPKAVYSSNEPLVSFWYRVTRVEDLGADRLLYGALRDLAPDTKMIVNLPSTIHLPITPGEAYEFACKVNDLKFFDPKTGCACPPVRCGQGVRLADDERALSRVLLAPAILYIALLVGAPFVLAIATA